MITWLDPSPIADIKSSMSQITSTNAAQQRELTELHKRIAYLRTLYDRRALALHQMAPHLVPEPALDASDEALERIETMLPTSASAYAAKHQPQLQLVDEQSPAPFAHEPMFHSCVMTIHQLLHHMRLELDATVAQYKVLLRISIASQRSADS